MSYDINTMYVKNIKTYLHTFQNGQIKQNQWLNESI